MFIICGSLSTMDLKPPMHSTRRKMLEHYILQSCTPQALLGRTWGTFLVNRFALPRQVNESRLCPTI